MKYSLNYLLYGYALLDFPSLFQQILHCMKLPFSQYQVIFLHFKKKCQLSDLERVSILFGEINGAFLGHVILFLKKEPSSGHSDYWLFHQCNLLFYKKNVTFHGFFYMACFILCYLIRNQMIINTFLTLLLRISKGQGEVTVL